MVKMATYGCKLCVTIIIIMCYTVPYSISVPLLTPSDILEASPSYCVVLSHDASQINGFEQLFNTLVNTTFVNETGVLFGRLQEIPLVWPNGRQLLIVGNVAKGELEHSILLFKRVKRDRSCLLVPEDRTTPPPAVHFKLPTSLDDETLDLLLDFINGNCATFRAKDGSLNFAGTHRKEILGNLFSSANLSQRRCSVKQCLEPTHADPNHEDFCLQDTGPEPYVNLYAHGEYIRENNLQECERIEVPTAAQFFHEYLSCSKPVIITGATQHWPAFKKWTNKFLRERYGSKKVHIKITPDGQYEGVEPISLWADHKDFSIPESVYKKLPYPDLVVVRPASLEIPFSEFLDLIENISMDKAKNISAYLEYSSIADYFPDLKKDIAEMQFFTNILELKHLNIWLSDGDTLGKLHFDPFDNFLCQISGMKQVLLYEPHDNTRLYEGHIQEAVLTYNAIEKVFYRKKLLDSTSMVMSPVDLLNPDLKRFPKFSEVRPLNCTIKRGEVLFMPSFWWHEVQSRPDISEHRNLAVNYWYEPFLTREFPCPECQLDINFKYAHLL